MPKPYVKLRSNKPRGMLAFAVTKSPTYLLICTPLLHPSDTQVRITIAITSQPLQHIPHHTGVPYKPYTPLGDMSSVMSLKAVRVDRNDRGLEERKSLVLKRNQLGLFAVGTNLDSGLSAAGRGTLGAKVEIESSDAISSSPSLGLFIRQHAVIARRNRQAASRRKPGVSM